MNKYFKVFRDISNNIFEKEYSEEEQRNYFKFVKSQHDIGFKKVIITSKMMLNILEEYFIDKKFTINEINFIEYDDELYQEIEILLKEIESDRAVFSKLLKKLKCVENHSSIDIKDIKMTSSERINGKYINFVLKVNGILIINEKGVFEIPDILKIVSRNI